MTDISPIFERAGIPCSKRVDIDEIAGQTYPLAEDIKDNWLVFAFLGFRYLASDLKCEKKQVKNFLTIGTGPGIDAIGAYHYFKPETIFLADLVDEVRQCAIKNLRRHIPETVMVHGHTGHLIEGMDFHGKKIDLAYANLPNIPADMVDTSTLEPSSFISRSLLRECPIKFDNALLSLQYQCLQQVKEVLSDTGSVVLAIGARMKFEIIQALFEESGFRWEERWTGFKWQTQPEEVITGYAKAEKAGKGPFIFYDYPKVMASGVKFSENGIDKLQNLLEPYELTAIQAWQHYMRGKDVGHLVAIMRGFI